MCMATSEVESTAALVKELNALKSQLSFKEREMQEMQRDASQTKRKLQAVVQENTSLHDAKRPHTLTNSHKPSSSSDTTRAVLPPSRLVHTNISEGGNTSAGASANTIPGGSGNSCSNVAAGDRDKQQHSDESLRQAMKQHAELLQHRHLRDVSAREQLQSHKEQVLQYCQTVSDTLTAVGQHMCTVATFTSTLMPAATTTLEGHCTPSCSVVKGTTQVTVSCSRGVEAGVMSRLRVLLHPPPPLTTDASSGSAHGASQASSSSTPLTPYTQTAASTSMSTKKPLTDVSSAQSSARTNASASLSCSHKYRTCVPHTTPSSILKSSHSYYTTTATTREGRRRADSIGNVTSPFISTGGNPLSPHKTPSRAHMLPAHQCDELRNLSTATTHALTNVRLQLHTVMQETITDRLFRAGAMHATLPLTPIDRLLYGLTSLSDALTRLARLFSRISLPSDRSGHAIQPTSHVSPPFDAVQVSLASVMTCIKLLLSGFDFRSVQIISKVEGHRMSRNDESNGLSTHNSSGSSKSSLDNGISTYKKTEGDQGMDRINDSDASCPTNDDSISTSSQVSLLTLGNDFRLKCVIALCDVCDFGFQERSSALIQVMCEVISSLMIKCVRFVSSSSGVIPQRCESVVDCNGSNGHISKSLFASSSNLEGETDCIDPQYILKDILAPLLQGNDLKQTSSSTTFTEYNRRYGALMTFLLLGRKGIYRSSQSMLPSPSLSSSTLKKSASNGDLRSEKSSNHDEGTWEDCEESDWMLDVLPLRYRSHLLECFTRLISVSAAVFSLFHEEQMLLSLNTKGNTSNNMKLSASGDATTSRLVGDTSTPVLRPSLPLPPTLVAASVASKGIPEQCELNSTAAPLVCEKLMQWAYFLPLQQFTPVDSFESSTDHSCFLRIREEKETFRANILKLFVAILSAYKDQGAQCLLGAYITAPLPHAASRNVNDSRRSERSKVLFAFRERNLRALQTFKILIEVCWDSVIAMDDAPTLRNNVGYSLSDFVKGANDSDHTASPSHTDDIKSQVLDLSSICTGTCVFSTDKTVDISLHDIFTERYFRKKASLIKDCSLLVELIHSSVCLSRGGTDTMANQTSMPCNENNVKSSKKLSLAELTKIAGCSDIFTNLLFRIYKHRVHSWVDAAAFENVMDLYD